MTEEQKLCREIYVGKLAWWITDKELDDVFSKFGKISEVIFAESKINGKSRGFAKIIYEEQGAALNAVTAMNGKQPFRDNDNTNIIVMFPDFSKRVPNNNQQNFAVPYDGFMAAQF